MNALRRMLNARAFAKRVTAPLSASAYRTACPDPLTHRVEVASDGEPVRVLCRRAKVESVLPDTSSYTQERPTCVACAKLFDREATT